MSDVAGEFVPAAPAYDASPSASAGTLLRQARIAQGLHIAALAMQLKVTPQTLEALESDQLERLPDPAFARALAKTMCRHLRIDAAPVLERMPQPATPRLEQVSRGLDTPFRERQMHDADEPSLLSRPVVWGPLLILLAALALYLWPQGWDPRPGATAPADAPAVLTLPLTSPAAGAGEGGASAAPPQVETVHSAPAAVAAPAGELVLRSDAITWVEVTDGRGQSLLARSLGAGETLGLDGTPPLKLRINNARALQVSYRGQPVDLADATRDNIARLELK